MSDYWAKRAERDMDYIQGQADRCLKIIGKAMFEAQSYLTDEALKILRTYAKRFNLTEEEAKAELAKPISRAEYDRLLARLKTMPEGPEKRKLEARASSGAYAFRISRAEALRENIAIETARVAQVIEDELTGQLRFTATEAYARRLFSIQKQAERIWAVPNIQTFTLSVQSPWFGGNYSENIWKNREALAQALEEKITAGYLSGKSHAKIAQEIQERFGVAFRVAERLVRTETCFLSNQANLEAYKRTGIKWYRWLAGLDTRTCEACGKLDHQVFEVEKAQVGVNFPPLHPNDRCTTGGVLDKDEPLTGERRGRDAQGKWKLFPKSMNYEQWRKWQEDRMGKEQFAIAQKMVRNQARDQAQYQDYRKLIGKNEFTASFQAFQAAKYNNPEAYGFLKLDYKRRNALLLDSVLALPNGDSATAAAEKFTRYLFNPENPDGWAKGVAFHSRLGYNEDNWAGLRKDILKAATQYPSTAQDSTQYGTRYEQKIVLYGHKSTPANVVVGWYVNEDKTWMTTAMIKEVK